MTHPILTALAALSDADLSDSPIVELPQDMPDVAAWLVEVGLLLATERSARQGGQRPLDTNSLSVATDRLTPSGYAALLAALYQLQARMPDGPQRRFMCALGFLLAAQGRLAGRDNLARQN